MKGLILKDFYMTAKYCRLIFLIDVVFIAMAFLSKENIMFMMFPILFSGVIPITGLSYDERCKWSEYSGVLPYSKAQIVSSKYLTGLIISALTAVPVLMFMIIRMYTLGGVNFSEALCVVCGMFAVSLLFPAVCLPFCFKFGTEKGRIAYYILIMLIAVGILPFINKESVSIEFTGFIPIIIFAVAAVYALSWAVSALLYKTRIN